MRTIKFRGKKINRNGEWAYGDLRILPDRILILPQRSYDAAIDRDAVDETTLGQFTGLHDAKGNPIYEGDIVQNVLYKDFIYKVVYDDNRFASFCMERNKDMFSHYFGEAMEAKDCEVIGNIHDNPELMKGE